MPPGRVELSLRREREREEIYDQFIIDLLFSSAFHCIFVKALETNQIQLLGFTLGNVNTIGWACDILICSFHWDFYTEMDCS